MARWQGLGTWLVIGGIVAMTGWGFRHIGHDAQAASPSQGAASPAHGARPVLRMTRAMARGQQPVHLDADMARRALRDGFLEVVLPDGTSYRVRMERQETHGGGHWSVVGRVETAVGSQSMVLTFGPNAVFGMLPMPDGHAMSVETHEGGFVTVAPAGGLTPHGKPLRGNNADYQVPDVQSEMAPEGTMLADRPIRIDGDVVGNAIDKKRSTTRIDVLALYSPELAALRGGRTIAETEVASRVAIANQAFIDSGTQVRLNLVGIREAATPDALPNDALLHLITADADMAAMRDAHGADLVAYVRPHAKRDATCGASWLNGAGLAGADGADSMRAFVVANVAPCGPLVLAHQLGHAMGAVHDRASQTDADGNVAYGAFEFSFAHRTPAFGTIMADPGRAPWVARFSNPRIVDCNGDACGIADAADDARSLDLMAPAIASFRDEASRAGK